MAREVVGIRVTFQENASVARSPRAGGRNCGCSDGSPSWGGDPLEVIR